MADGRFVNKKIAYDVRVHAVSLEADYLFTRMIPHLDREGRMPGNPRQVKALAAPMRDELSYEDISGCLLELSGVGLVEWYVVEGRMCLEFPGFDKNQKGLRKEREAESLLPSPQHDDAVEVTRSLLDGSGLDPEDSGVDRAKVKSKYKSKSKSNNGAKAPTSNGGRSTNGDSPGHEVEVVENEEPEPPDPAEWMHDAWQDVLGYDSHPLELTEKRRTKYRAMYDEQLSNTPDPEAAWQAVLYAVTQSEHHMGTRSYQMPESLLRNPERRSTWVQNTISTLEEGGREVDRKAKSRQEQIRRGLEAAMEAPDAA